MIMILEASNRFFVLLEKLEVRFSNKKKLCDFEILKNNKKLYRYETKR